MRKSGWAAVAGLGTLALLLTACGGSSSSTGGSNSTPTATNAATQPAAQPSSNIGVSKGTTVLIVEKTKLGYVLALANGHVVYTYSADKKGGTPTCTSACASQWPAVTGNPQASTADTLPGTLAMVATADGAKQVTYNGLPLYTLKGAKAFAVTGNGAMWHVVMMSKSDVKYGA